MSNEPLTIEVDPETLATPVDHTEIRDSTVAEAAKPRKSKAKKLLLLGVGLAALIGAGTYGWDYWTTGQYLVETDDAYVKADSTIVAPKVSGYLDNVLVNDNQPVKAGQVLAHIDDRDFRAALTQAQADVAAAEAAVTGKQAALTTQQSVIDAARATIQVDNANLTFAQQDDQRYKDLATTGYGSTQNAQRAGSRNAEMRAVLARDTAALATAQNQVEILKAQLAEAKGTLDHDRAVVAQAELNLSYTTIVAAVDGTIGNRSLRVGQYVQAGTQLMAVVPTQAAYIVANFKETQLTDVQPGQPVEVEIDMFPGKKAHGHVDSMAPASGQEFSLLPPDNATGNFTKIVQRIPVKIVLDQGSPLAGDLRAGMSVNPVINTKTPAAAQPVSKLAAVYGARAG